MSDEIRTAADLRASIVDQRGGIERFDGPQRRLLDALVFELAKKPNEIDVRIVTDLTALLPQPVSAPERDNHPDPREVMFKIYMEMRERGEVPPEGHFRHRIGELEAENARLRAQLVGVGLVPALPDVTGRQDDTSGNLKTVIAPTEADITPPSELGEFYRGVRPGPDDPPKRSPCIDGTSAPAAAAPAAYDYSANQDWKDWIEPDGSIRTTPRGRGKDWGPV